MLNDAAQPKPDQVSPTIPPRKPVPTNQRESREVCVTAAQPAFARPAARTGHRDDLLAQIAHIPFGTDAFGPLAQPNIIRGRGPLHPTLREENRDPPHPRCLPSMSHRRGDAGLSPIVPLW